jgi:lipopolysaccharide/colanic/teichoic acid biosynthesis glycosyltransferase
MYPYSEFIQKKVYEDAQLTSTGKFENDFRITKIGKLLRKYWVDEIPQLLDWLRGKIKLVGIRAMSQHYFGLYPKEYQELYYKVKPGIISPIFDEKTIGFAEIVRIEQKYLESYLINPIRTDIKYFFITLKHVLKGVRSK